MSLKKPKPMPIILTTLNIDKVYSVDSGNILWEKTFPVGVYPLYFYWKDSDALDAGHETYVSYNNYIAGGYVSLEDKGDFRTIDSRYIASLAPLPFGGQGIIWNLTYEESQHLPVTYMKILGSDYGLYKRTYKLAYIPIGG